MIRRVQLRLLVPWLQSASNGWGVKRLPECCLSGTPFTAAARCGSGLDCPGRVNRPGDA